MEKTENTPPLTTEVLRQTTHDIRQMFTEGKSIDEVREKHRTFSMKYPKLIEKLLEPSMNEEQLQYIFEMFDSVQQRRTSLENASKRIGKDMFDKYVAPDLTPEQRARVKQRMSVLEDQSPEELAQAVSHLAQQQVQSAASSLASAAPSSNSNAPSSDAPSVRRRKKKLRKPPL